MRKRYRSVIVFWVLLTQILLYQTSYAQPTPIVMKFYFLKPEIVQNVFVNDNISYDSVRVKSLDIYGAPGKPVIPLKTVKILLPQDGDLESIEIINGNKIKLDGSYRIEYGQTQIPISSGLVIKTEPNQTIYSSIEPFPGILFSKVTHIQEFRGYKILILNLYPVQYIPKEGLLTYFEDMTVTVNLKPAVEISPLFRNLPKDRAEVIRKVDNPELVATYTKKLEGSHIGCICDPSDSYDYVIITNNALKNSSGSYTFQDLIAQKAWKGITATIVTVEEIEADSDYRWDGEYGDGSPFFDDTAAHIRNFIKDAHINWETDYVLLGGDGDGADVGGESGDNIIPARMLYAFTYKPGEPLHNDNKIPADIYYGALNGSWNNDEDDKWGEDGEEDLYAEVYIGRAPVDSQQEVSNFVMKTLAYESADEPWYLEKAWMVGERMDDITWGGSYKNEIKYGSNNWGYTTFGFPQGFNVGKLYDAIYPGWEKDDLITIINNNTHLINHLGHSSTLYVMKLCNAPFFEEGPTCGTSGYTDVDDLINTKYCFIYSQGCYPGSFDNWHCSYPLDPPPDYPGGYTKNDSIAEHFVTSENGAFAVIMNSRYGWYVPGGTNGASQRFDRQFWDAVFGEGITEIGKANQDSKEDTAGLFTISGSTKWCYYALNLLGDPEVEIWTGRAFCVKNSSDDRVAWFDSLGNLFLKGSKYIGAGWKEPSGTNDEFIVEDGSGPIVYIDESGDLYLKEGDVIEENTTYTATDGDEFRVQNSIGVDVAIINADPTDPAAYGNIYLKGKLYQHPD